MKITVSGTWSVLWGAWHLAWAFGLVWVPFFWPAGASLYFRVLYTVFLPLEIVGAIDAANDPKGREVAKTMSQFRQFVAQQGRGPSVVGWKAIGGYSGLIDAVVVWYVLKDVHPAVGAIAGTLVALWLVAHFGWRDRVG